MRKLLIVGLFVNAALLAGNWYEHSAIAESRGGAGVKPCKADPTKYSLDTNDDGSLDLADFIFGLKWYFTGTEAPRVCLDSSDLEARLAQAEAELAQAEAELAQAEAELAQAQEEIEASVAPCAKAGTADSDLSVRYELSISDCADATPGTLQVEMTVDAPGDDQCVEVHFPNLFGKAGAPPDDPPLGTFVTIEQVSGGSLRCTPDQWIRQIDFDDDSEKAVVTYTVKQAYDEADTDSFKIFYPTFQPTFWYFSAYTTLLMPQSNGELAITMVFHPPEGATGWTLASSVGVQEGGCDESCELSFQVTSEEFFGLKEGEEQEGDPGKAVNFIFGETEHRSINLEDGAYTLHVNISSVPDYFTNADELFDEVVGLVKNQRDFWPTLEQTDFLVTLRSYDNSKNDRFGGFRWNGGLSSMLPQTPSQTPTTGPLALISDARAHLNHEYSHNWLRPEYIEPTLEMAWFSEGTADFYMEYFVYDTSTDEERFDNYVQRYNFRLREYWESPQEAREMNVAELEPVFWDELHYNKQPYWRGFLMLHNWHARARADQATAATFHEFIRAVIQEGRITPVSLFKYQEIAKQYVPGGIEEDLQDFWITGGASICPEDNVFGDCYQVIDDADEIPQVVRDKEAFATQGTAECTKWFNE